MPDWKTVRLGDAADFTLGFPFKSADFSDAPDDVRLLRGDNVAQRRVRWDNAKRWPKAQFDELGQFHLTPGDIVLAMDRPWIEAGLKWAVLSPQDCPSLLVQRVLRLRAKPGGSQRFLSHVLGSRAFTDHVLSVQTGTAVPHISGRQVADFTFSLPSLPEQEQIAEVLSTLDEKIELNRRMNEALEAMVQAIFRDWFVGFGPVRRKLAGETDSVAIMGGLTPDPARAAELAALFPAELNDSGLPQGWIERPLDQIAEFLNGLALQKFPAVDGESSLPVIKIAELRNGLTEKSNRASPHLPNKYIVRDGDYLFSWSGSLVAKVWTEGDGALNQHLFKVSSTSYPQWFFGAWVEHHLPEFQQIAASKATTMGHIQRGHLTSAMTVCPPQPTLDVMATVLAPLWDRRIQNDLENRTLAETRDYLLPRLMSGEVRVTPSDTESAAA